MTHAVIKTGGKQYLVAAGDRIKVDHIAKEAGETIVFDEVLLTHGAETAVGNPLVTGVTVEGKIIRQGRHDKVMGVKLKPKKRQRVLFGHKQAFTEVEITKISKGKK